MHHECAKAFLDSNFNQTKNNNKTNQKNIKIKNIFLLVFQDYGQDSA